MYAFNVPNTSGAGGILGAAQYGTTTGGNPSVLSMIRVANIFKTVAAVAVTAGHAGRDVDSDVGKEIPAYGFRAFPLRRRVCDFLKMGRALKKFVLRSCWRAMVKTCPAMGNGILSATANNELCLST